MIVSATGWKPADTTKGVSSLVLAARGCRGGIRNFRLTVLIGSLEKPISQTLHPIGLARQRFEVLPEQLQARIEGADAAWSEQVGRIDSGIVGHAGAGDVFPVGEVDGDLGCAGSLVADDSGKLIGAALI